MSRNRKYFPNKAVLLVTTRTEEGLPIVCSDVMNFIIWGILAKAREMYKIKVCHFVFLSNHFHGILVVDSPQDVPNFMGYVKGEISHAINRLLGRRQRTIWQDGYDSPVLLTVDDIRRYIKYIYQNPSRAKLEHTICEYPGVSSWEMFTKDKLVKRCRKLPRDLIPKLSSPALGVNEQRKIVNGFEKLELKSSDFVLEPDAWRESFPGAFSNEEIIEEIKKEVEVQKAERIKRRINVIGATALRRESMLKEHVPNKYSPRMICISSDLVLREAFIETYRYLSNLAYRVYQSWLRADYSQIIPASMFCPRRPEFASELSIY